VRANFQLPATEGFFQTLSVGLDYKLYLENLRLGADRQKNPVHYWPFSLQYVASWFRDGAATTLTASALLSLRPISGSTELFDAKRYGASAAFALLRLGLERFDDLPFGLQLLERSQGQLSPAPLVGSEQIIIGGADTVRGYPEAQAAGDQGVSAGVELRSPSLLAPFGARDANWLRLHAFTDAGLAAIHSPLPEQKREFALASWGGGARLELYAMFRASAEVGVPLRSEGTTPKGTPRFLFRVAGDF
jgi:hemolysin activation/secretion protein